MEPQKSKYTINDSFLRLIIIQVQNFEINYEYYVTLA